MFRILTNTFSSWRRAVQSRPAPEPLDEDGSEAFSIFEHLHQPFLLWWSAPEQEFLNRLLQQDLERAIEALSETFRVVVVLADVQGLSYQEIADTIQTPIGTVRSRLARGRVLLQKALWRHGIEGSLVNATSSDRGSA